MVRQFHLRPPGSAVNDLDVLGQSAGDRRGPNGARHSAPEPPPWRLLVGVLAGALLAVVGLVWMVGAQLGEPGPRQPAAASPGSTAPGTAARSAPPSGAATVTSPTPRVTFSPAPTLSLAPAPTPTRPAPTSSVATPARPPQPALVRVPGVVGERLPAATATLQAAGFRVTTVDTPVRSPRDNRRVLAQSPSAGTSARRGELVTLLVGIRA
jgi:PASTA domain